MSLDQTLLRAFLATYRAGSVTEAAAALRVTQPAVSMQLARLERQLGVTLFERRARGVTPTPAGDDLARQVAPALDALERVSLEPGTRTLAGSLRLGGPADFMAINALPALVPLIQQGLRITAVPGLADELLTMTAKNELDLTISAVRPNSAALESEPLYDEVFILVASARHALARRSSPAAVRAALSDIPLIAFAAQLPIIRRYWRLVFGTRIGRTASLVVPDLRAITAVLVAGGGMSVLPSYVCKDALRTGELVQLVTTPDAPSNTLYVAWPKSGGVPSRRVAVHQRLRAAAPSW